jgi:uncharacterized protein HemY
MAVSSHATDQFNLEGQVMFLDSATSINDLITHGAKPAIAFLDVARDALEEGDEDRAELFIVEAQERLRDMVKREEKLLATRRGEGEHQQAID